MSSTSQAMLNQSLFEDQEMSFQMGLYSSLPNWIYTPFGYHQSPRTLNNSSSMAADVTSILTESILSSTTLKHRDFTSHLGESEARLIHRPTTDLWPWGEVNECLSSKRCVGDHEHLGVTAMKMKKMKARRKVREPRFCFKTMSDVDVLDDGYKWRKYGQKVVKSTIHPRSYYRCTQDDCRVKKRVERLAEDPRMVITTYEGRHVHSPSLDLDESQAPSQFNNFFW